MAAKSISLWSSVSTRKVCVSGTKSPNSWEYSELVLIAAAVLAVVGLVAFAAVYDNTRHVVDAIVVTDVKDLREGFLYYALTVFEELPKKRPEMEQFFDRLKTEEDMSDTQVEIAKESFSSQGITYIDLAITDGELERIGINQLGLRKAILSVIKRNV